MTPRASERGRGVGGLSRRVHSLFALVQPSAWKENSPKSKFSHLHESFYQTSGKLRRPIISIEPNTTCCGVGSRCALLDRKPWIAEGPCHELVQHLCALLGDPAHRHSHVAAAEGVCAEVLLYPARYLHRVHQRRQVRAVVVHASLLCCRLQVHLKPHIRAPHLTLVVIRKSCLVSSLGLYSCSPSSVLKCSQPAVRRTLHVTSTSAASTSGCVASDGRQGAAHSGSVSQG